MRYQSVFNYNIPRKIRELQFAYASTGQPTDYNIPRKIRELQSRKNSVELLLIITYQEKLGNYNSVVI